MALSTRDRTTLPRSSRPPRLPHHTTITARLTGVGSLLGARLYSGDLWERGNGRDRGQAVTFCYTLIVRPPLFRPFASPRAMPHALRCFGILLLARLATPFASPRRSRWEAVNPLPTDASPASALSLSRARRFTAIAVGRRCSLTAAEVPMARSRPWPALPLRLEMRGERPTRLRAGATHFGRRTTRQVRA